MTTDTIDISTLPPDLVRAAAEAAATDAERASSMLREIGVAPPEGHVRFLPAGFLSDLGAALRLLFWERAGLTVHTDAGLPSATDVLRAVFADAAARLAEPGRPSPPRFANAVFQLTVERLAWAGPRELGAEVELGVPDQGTLVEVVAQLLWAHRHDSPASE